MCDKWRRSTCYFSLHSSLQKGSSCFIFVISNSSFNAFILQIKFGQNSGNDIQLVAAESINEGKGIRARIRVKKTGDDLVLNFSVPGKYLAFNSCAAIAVCMALDLNLKLCAERLEKFEPVGMRVKPQEIELRNGAKITILNDAYNANPQSVRSSLEILNGIESEGKRFAFLGDMLELGESSGRYHEEILDACERLQLDGIGIVGLHFKTAAAKCALNLPVVLVCETPLELGKVFKDILRNGDVVLVKGSRGLKMEETLITLRE